MQLYRHYRDWPAHWQHGVVAIGNFDGLHLGHQAVIAQLMRAADAADAPPIILCFEPHPRRFFQPGSPRLRLMRLAEKVRQLEKMGVQAMLVQRFNRAFSELSAEAFIREVLVAAMQARIVMTGEDFMFGHRRTGNAQLLAQYAEQTGAFRYHPVAPVGNTGEGKYSSSKVREHLRQGEIALAAAMLGRPYRLCGRVIHGDQRGRTIGFPTANILPPPVLLPRLGVYAVRGEYCGKPLAGVANLGCRPTVKGERIQLEVHWFDFNADLYGETLCVELVAHLRDEQRFDNLEVLKAQIAQDVQAARELLGCT